MISANAYLNAYPTPAGSQSPAWKELVLFPSGIPTNQLRIWNLCGRDQDPDITKASFLGVLVSGPITNARGRSEFSNVEANFSNEHKNHNGNTALLQPELELTLEFVCVWTPRLLADANPHDGLSLGSGAVLAAVPSTGAAVPS